jgi:hypothetical protein
MDTNPATEVADDAAAVDKLAAIFGGEPDPVEDTQEAPPEPQGEDTAPGEQSADGGEDTVAGSEQDTSADDAEEVEFEGKAYKVPKELKGALLRQSDYTQKTQEVANLRRQVEDKTQFLEAREQLMAAAYQDAADFRALQMQAQQYESLDWAALYNADPGQALKLRDQRDKLTRDIAEKEKSLQAKVQQQQQLRQMHLQKQMEIGKAELARRVGNLTDSDRQATIQQAKALGFSEEEIGSVTDARWMHALVELARFKSKGEAQAKIAEKKVATAKPLQAKARSSPQAQQNAAYLDAYNKLRKTGRDEYAEVLLNAKFGR